MSSKKGKNKAKASKTATPDESQRYAATVKHQVEALQSITYNLPLLKRDEYHDKDYTYDPNYLDIFEDEKEAETSVMLGYLDEKPFQHPFIHRRDYMLTSLGKVGGFPSWLTPVAIPSTLCTHCHLPMRFLLQSVCPIPPPLPDDYEDDSPLFDKQQRLTKQTFHRQIYVFICSNQECLIQHNSVRVFRSQLPLENPFYAKKSLDPRKIVSYDVPPAYPPEVLPHSKAALKGTIPFATSSPDLHSDLCVVCGSRATLPAVKDHPTTLLVCSEEHQKIAFQLDLTPTQQNDDHVHSQVNKNVHLNKTCYPRFSLTIDQEVLDSDYMEQSNSLFAPTIVEDAASLEESETEQSIIDISKLNISDPSLLEKLETYQVDEQSKTEQDKAEDDVMFGPSEDNQQLLESGEADLTHSLFTTRLEYTLPPLPNDDDENEDEDDDDDYHQHPQSIFTQQILRYFPYRLRVQQNIHPLWLHQHHRLDTQSLPEDDQTHWSRCQCCGGRRLFELQIMPYLATYLLQQYEKDLTSLSPSEISTILTLKKQCKSVETIDSLDFGTIVIYTCENACDAQNSPHGYGYVEEFAYVQPPM